MSRICPNCGEYVTSYCGNPSVTSVRTGDTSPYTGEAPVRCKIGTFFVIAGLDYVLNAATSKVITV